MGGSTGTTRKWTIKVTQYECGNLMAPEQDCLHTIQLHQEQLQPSIGTQVQAQFQQVKFIWLINIMTSVLEEREATALFVSHLTYMHQQPLQQQHPHLVSVLALLHQHKQLLWDLYVLVLPQPPPLKLAKLDMETTLK